MSDAMHQDRPGAGLETSDLARRETFLADLNARIARLAIALHVPLHSEADVQAAMHALEPGEAVVGAEHSAQRRAQGLRAELRGLLVLRYGVEQRCVEEFGVEVTQQIMAEAEAQLQREGFQPGADGVDLQRIFEQG